MGLEYLLLDEPPPGEIFEIPATHWNDLLREIARRLNDETIVLGGDSEFVHPWKVTAQRWTDGPAAIDPTRSWKIFTRPGSVNDEAAFIPYLKQGDPRAWVMPANHPAAKDKGRDADRMLHERDQPPFLLMETPGPGLLSNKQFAEVSDAARPEFFRTEAAWKRKLCRAFVMVSAEPSQVSTRPLEVVTLRRFRVFCGQRPTRSIARAGGYCELAWLWLLRGKRPEEDELYVEQRTFWCLGSVHVQTSGILSTVGAEGYDELTQLFLEIAAIQEANSLDEAGNVEFWTE